MKVGKVAILGRPNSGKSTLMNACIGENLAPVSSVANTTRVAIKGIYSDESTQIVFIDAPGFQGETSIFSRFIRKETLSSLRQSDAILRIIDVSREYGEEDSRIDELISFTQLPVVTVYSKTDLRSVRNIPENSIVSSKADFPIQKIVSEIAKLLPEGDFLYDPDFYTDSSPVDLIPDVVRSACFVRLIQEIPHSLYVRVEDVEEADDIVKILAYVVVETDSQKRIVIGKKGSLITEIGTESRIRLEDIFGKKVFLQLRVTTEPNWTKNQALLKKLFPHA